MKIRAVTTGTAYDRRNIRAYSRDAVFAAAYGERGASPTSGSSSDAGSMSRRMRCSAATVST